VAPEEYRELVHFIGKRFDAVDRRFDAMVERFGHLDLGVLEEWPTGRLGENFIGPLLETLPGLDSVSHVRFVLFGDADRERYEETLAAIAGS